MHLALQICVISSWHDRKILAGGVWDEEIKKNLKTADIVLLLISVDFLHSQYCWDVALKMAIERDDKGEACVIPVILRSVDWAGAPFARLQALPKNAKPIKSWTDQDEAFTDVARGIRAAVEALKQKREKLRQTELASEKGVDYTKLRDLLAAKRWEEADHETYLVMLQVWGRKDGDYIKEEELLNFPCTDLRTIDHLWVKYTNGHFGFSVQKEIYLSVGAKPDGEYYNEAWEKFGDCVGWRVEENFLYYSKVTFDTYSPKRHLPFSSFLGMWKCGEEKVGVFFEMFYNVSSLASRLVNCNI